MASRKEKIKEKRTQEEQEVRQVQMAVGVFALLIVIAVVAYILNDSGFFTASDDEPGTSETVANIENIDRDPYDYPGTPAAICEHETPSNPGGQDGQYTEAPEMILEDGVDYRAIFCTTEGAVYIDLFEEDAPLTVNNTVFLAGEGFYNNMIFHRVLEGFMAQGGDPTGTGRGGPGYRFADEFQSGLAFDRPYLLAMANSGPGTNGSQFFITFVETPHLNNLHTIFGEVISGQAAVDSLSRVDPQRPSPNIIPSDLITVVIVTPDQVTE